MAPNLPWFDLTIFQLGDGAKEIPIPSKLGFAF